MSLASDVLAMLNGPLGVSVEGPDGCIRAMLDQSDEENWRIGEFAARSQTRLDRVTCLLIATAKLGTIVRGSLLTVKGRTADDADMAVRVQDLRLDSDGLQTKLYVVTT